MRKTSKISASILAASLAVGTFGVSTAVFAAPETSGHSDEATTGVKLPETKEGLADLVKAFEFIDSGERDTKEQAIRDAGNYEDALAIFKVVELANVKGKATVEVKKLGDLTVAQLNKALEDIGKAEDKAGVAKVQTVANLQANKNVAKASLNGNKKLDDTDREKLLVELDKADTVDKVNEIVKKAQKAADTVASLATAKTDAKATIEGLKHLSKELKTELLKKVEKADKVDDVKVVVDNAKAANDVADKGKHKSLVSKIEKSKLSAEDKVRYIALAANATDKELKSLEAVVDNHIAFLTESKYWQDAVKKMNLTEEQRKDAIKAIEDVKFDADVRSPEKFRVALDKFERIAGERNLADGKLDTYAYGVTPIAWTGDITASGEDRYATAVKVSQRMFPNEARTVFIATGENYVDSLVTAPIAAKLGGPVLLAQHNKVDRDTLREIERLNPKQVIIIGGEKALNKYVESDIERAAPRKAVIKRISGKDRYDTARALADLFHLRNAPLVVAIGDNFPDALVAGALAGSQGANLTIVPSTGVTKGTEDTIKMLAPTKTTVVGNVLDRKDLNDINKITDRTVIRIGGKDRYATAARVARMFTDNKAAKPKFAVVTTGLNFPDAVVGSVPAIVQGGPVLLTKGKNAYGLYDDRDVPANQLLVGGVTTSIDSRIHGE